MTLFRRCPAALFLLIVLPACTPTPTPTAAPPTLTSPVSTPLPPAITSTTPLPTVAVPATPTPTPPPSPINIAKDVETKLREIVTKEISLPLETLTCPPKNDRKPGDRLDCAATIEQQPFTITVEFTDANGQFKWTTKNLLVVTKLEQFIQTRLKEKETLDVQVKCGDTKIKAVKPNDSFTCTVTPPQGDARTANITVKDEQGNVDIALK